MPRKVILYIAVSLDGFIADQAGKIDWLETTTEFMEEDNRYAQFYATIDTVILGRTTYDQVVNELAPGNYPYQDATSYVLTSRPGENLENVIFTQEDLSLLVKKLKSQPGKEIWLVGGSSVVMPLLKANLIDEYQISTLPIILGKGIRLFTDFEPSLVLETVTSSLKNGIVTTTYRKPQEG